MTHVTYMLRSMDFDAIFVTVFSVADFHKFAWYVQEYSGKNCCTHVMTL